MNRENLVFSWNLLLEEAKNRADLGIGAEMLSAEILERTGAEIIQDEAVIAGIKEYRWSAVPKLLNSKLLKYNMEEWYACLELQVLLEYAIPMLSRVIALNPLVHGLYWHGEILWRILNIEEFWKKHKEWKLYFEGVLEEVFDSFSKEELKAMIGERPYEELKKRIP